jgi:hypothetical protein
MVLSFYSGAIWFSHIVDMFISSKNCSLLHESVQHTAKMFTQLKPDVLLVLSFYSSRMYLCKCHSVDMFISSKNCCLLHNPEKRDAIFFTSMRLDVFYGYRRSI